MKKLNSAAEGKKRIGENKPTKKPIKKREKNPTLKRKKKSALCAWKATQNPGKCGCSAGCVICTHATTVTLNE